MNDNDKDEVPMLSDNRQQLLDKSEDSQFHRRTSRARSSSFSLSVSSRPSYLESHMAGHTGPLRSEKKSPFVQMSGPLYISSTPQDLYNPANGALGYSRRGDMESTFNRATDSAWPSENYNGKNEHLSKSGPLGMCNDPYCTTCPSSYKASPQKYRRTSNIFESHSDLYGDAKGWARTLYSFLYPYVPGVINPHTNLVQHWNRFFVVSCIVAIFVDPLFFFILSTLQNKKCIVMNKDLATAFVVLRSITDAIYLFHILLQFRLAYVAPETTVVGSGDLVTHPKKIAFNYFTGFFLIDIFAVLPVPQVIVLFILPHNLSSSGANYAKNLLRAAVLLQYIPRLYRFLPLMAGQSPSGFIFESAWENFVINLLTFVLLGHIVGSWWYLFGLQRVNQCLRDACSKSKIQSCAKVIDCGYGEYQNFASQSGWANWTNNPMAIACFTTDGDFKYGIYQQAVNLTAHQNFSTRYIYSFFWGFQQISTLAGNLTPSYFVWEVLFTVAIIGLGLLFFALLVGNMLNFLQSLGRRRMEMTLRLRDVEQWMRHRRLPEDLRRKVIAAERYNWAATRGVNEVSLIENLPEDLQREIRQHLFNFLKKVRIFAMMEEPILDAIRARLRQRTYIQGSCILYHGDPIEKMVFIVRGKMESVGDDRVVVPLAEGDVCGEELLTWCLEFSSASRGEKKIRHYGQRLHSTRQVRCLTNVEAFTLRDEDLEDVVTDYFARFLRNPRVQRAIRYESPYWRCFAATHIQVVWRYRNKRFEEKRQ